MIMDLPYIQELIGNTSTLHGSMQLDITTGCMSGVTAACVYDTLLSGVQVVIDYFTFIGREELLEKISMGQLSSFFLSFDIRNHHTMMISDIATSAWLIDFCHKAI